MATTVADVMVATLRASGVQRIYGIPGDSLNGFTDAMRRDGGITWEHVRHEEAAAVAAGAGAALAGELAGGGGRGQLRAGQPAPDQRPVRRQPQPGAGAGGRGPHPGGRDRPAVLPGDT